MSVNSPSLQGMRPAARPDALNATLRAASRRLRLLLVLRYGSRALCWSALPCALAVALSKTRWYETPTPLAVGGVIGLSLLVAVILAFARRLTVLDVAKITERRTDLKERLSSAVEFRDQHVDPNAPFQSALMSDAAQHANGVNIRKAFPARLPWELPVGALFALLLFLAFYLPTLPHFWTKEHAAEVAEVHKMALKVERIAKEAEKSADQQKLDETKKAAAEARKLSEDMKRGKMDKKQSLVALQKLTKKMEETQQRLAQPPGKKSLEEARKDFQKALDKLQRDKDEEAKKEDAARKAMKTAQARDAKKPDGKMEAKPKESEAMKQSREAMKQMADALANQDNQQMQQAMQKMADQMKKGEMSKEEMQQMQQALQQLAQSLKDTNQQDAANKMQQLSQMMQSSEGNMDPKSLQQMAMMMQQIGNQMGKQDPNGKFTMDAKALGDLAQQLKDGRMTMAMNGKDGAPSSMRSKGHGKGYNGEGGPSTAMKDPGATSPKLIAIGKPNLPAGKGKNGSAEEFAKYLAMTSKTAKYLPNGKIAGTRSQTGQEQQISLMGDPQAAKSNAPYYNVVQTSKKQAESTLSKENIPASLKKQVKDYFDSIK